MKIRIRARWLEQLNTLPNYNLSHQLSNLQRLSGDYEARTQGLLNTIQALPQLSYTPVLFLSINSNLESFCLQLPYFIRGRVKKRAPDDQKDFFLAADETYL